MVNNRLIWYLESNKILTELQSGFRKGRSTTDQLVRLESFVREAFVRGEHVTAVFFDLEKAYDTTWKYGILKDLQDAGLKGRLPCFISNFLDNRKFCVRVGSFLSDTYKQEMGVPQGSILSVTLFILKMNNIVKCLPAGVRGSLFVDDFLICYRSKSIPSMERVLQVCLKKIEEWADNNGFQFSKTKTVCMHFCNKITPHPEPCLKLNNSDIPVVEETKFLGVTFDSKLTFRPHIAYLKQKCLKAMNLLRVVTYTDWGADSTTLLRLYRSLVRSKLDYGCIVYGSTRDSYVVSLDRVQNAALRVCLGAFRTTPISSLHVEANEPPLRLRREMLALQYMLKLRSNPSNPAYSCVFESNLTSFFIAKPQAIPTLGIRLRQALSDTGVSLDSIAEHAIPSSAPWLLRPPGFDYTLFNLGTKSNTSPDLYLSVYNQLVSEKYDGYQKIFTDGSKQGAAVGAAAVTTNKVLVKRLPNHASIFSAEAQAILLAIDIISQSNNLQFLIVSDSYSCIKAIENRNLQNPLVVAILEHLHQKLNSKNSIIFIWVPSHIGIAGNTAADATAKAALNLSISNTLVPHSDFKPLISSHIKKCWQNSWDSEPNNKLQKIQPKIQPCIVKFLPRRDEILVHRLRVGHTYLTHSYLLHKENPPECDTCHLPLTVEHFLLSCCKYTSSRQKFYNAATLQELFEKVRPHFIVAYIKEIELYHKL
jgi:ribonuclease HI